MTSKVAFHRSRTAVAVLLILSLTAMLAGVLPMTVVARAEEVVRLVVAPMLSEHEDMVVQVLITRDEEHQVMTLTLESPTYYSSSEHQLEGLFAPRVKVVRFQNVPAGWYEVTSVVSDRRQKVKGYARRSVVVLPR